MSWHFKLQAKCLNKKLGDEVEINGIFFKIVHVYRNGSMKLEALDGRETVREFPSDDFNYAKRERKLKRMGLWTKKR